MWLLAGLWVLYYAIHSMLAASRVKNWLFRQLPGLRMYYRLGYNVVAVVGFAGVYLYAHRVPDVAVGSEWGNVGRILGGILVAMGLVLGIQAFRGYSWREFLGLKQVEGDERPEVLVTTGLNAYVRHPLYFAGLLVLVGYGLWAQSIRTWVFVGVSMVYVWIGTYWEEKKLKQQFGEAYVEYQRQVKRLIPSLFVLLALLQSRSDRDRLP